MHARRIDVGVYDARRFTAVGEHLAPRIDDQRMAVGRAVTRMLTAHRGRKEEARVLYRAGFEQRVPVDLACGALEGRGDREVDRARFRERPVKLREAQVVADAQADRAP